MGKVIGITGTPGTGKKSTAPLVAQRLGMRCIGLNELARSSGLATSSEESEVDTDSLRRELSRRLGAPTVVHGHLLPYSMTRAQVSRVAVLRCEPGVLKERLTSRGYAEGKVLDNVEAELIGMVSADAYDTFGAAKTFEVDTTYLTAPEAADLVSARTGVRTDSAPRIDWTLNYDSGRKLRSLLTT